MGFDVDKVKYAARSDRLRRVMVNLAATAIKKSTKTVADELGLHEPLDTDSPAIRAILRDMASRIVDIEETTRERVRGYVQFGNEHGLSVDELAKAIRQDASGAFGQSRAQTIARTESAVLYSQTSAAGWRDSGLVDRVWIFDGPDCILPGQRWIPVGELQSLSRGWFDGDAVSVECIVPSAASSRNIAVGPNHPILTDRGWVRAQFLRPGDNLIYCAFGDIAHPLAESQINDVPTIEESFEALGGFESATTRPTLPGDFHKDGIFCQGEVWVVRPDLQLLDVRHAALVKYGCDLALVWPDVSQVPLSADCACGQFVGSPNAAPSGIVGSRDLGEPAGGIESPPLNVCTCRDVTRESKVPDNARNRRETTSEPIPNRGTSEEFIRIQPDNFVTGHATASDVAAIVRTESPLGVVSRRELTPAHFASGDTNGGSTTLGIPCHATVLSVERFPYCGPVYDVSAGGAFLIDGIIARNCGWSEHDDDDKADGSIRTLEEYEATPISHPNCLRSAAPYQGDALDGIRDAGKGQPDD